MGTSYTFDGSIRVTPPLNFREIITARETAMKMLRNGYAARHTLPENVFERSMPLKPEIIETTEDTDRGTLVIKEASRIIPSHEGEGSLSYAMGDVMRALIKALPGHSWSGEVIAVCEERLSAYKTVVTTEKGKSVVTDVVGSTFIHWKDGSSHTEISSVL